MTYSTQGDGSSVLLDLSNYKSYASDNPKAYTE